MGIPSKWDKTCNVCGSSWKQGELINKQKSGKWCVNPNCAEDIPPPPKPVEKPSPVNLEKEIEEMTMASMGIATRYIEEHLSGEDNSDGERMILRNLIYKKCMDAMISRSGR